MLYAIRIAVTSGNSPGRVDGSGEGPCGARWIHSSKGAVGSSQKPVKHDLASIGSGDRPCRVDEGGARAEGRHGTWNIKCGESAVGSPQEAVTRAACVIVGSRDGSGRVDASGLCKADGAGGIERGEYAVGSPQKAVLSAAGVE